MTDFDYDVMQKKRIAQGAKHRVNGSKSRRCSLPSDNLTPAQRQKLNGPVTAWNLNAPMSWAEFKSMPRDLQRDYLTGLHQRFGIGERRLTEMFPVTDPTVYRYLKAQGLKGLMGSHRILSQTEKKVWEEFLRGSEEDCDAPAVEVMTKEQFEAEREPTGFSLCDLLRLLCGGTIRMEGSARELLPNLVSLLGGSDAYLNVSFCFTNKEEQKIESISDERTRAV